MHIIQHPSPAFAPPERALCIVCESAVLVAFGATSAEVRAATRLKLRVVRARHVAIYLAHVGCGLTYTQAGRGFLRDRTSVRNACAAIEDARDDAALDLALSWLEQAVRHYSKAFFQTHDIARTDNDTFQPAE